jgi:hypothetical protein
MSAEKSDPTHVTQFRRRWDDRPVRIKYLSEMTPKELDNLAVEWGLEEIVTRPRAALAALETDERRGLALRLGRQRLERLEARRQRERAERAVS